MIVKCGLPISFPAILFAFVLSCPCHGSDLVFLFDGTWNNSIDYGGTQKKLRILPNEKKLSVTSKEHVALNEISTNIARVFMLLDDEKANQKAIYIRGVGTGGITDEYNGGAFGAGAEARINAALSFLKDNWKDGDEICIFGFSRGAAIARMFAKRPELKDKKIRFIGLFDTVAAFGMPATKFQEDGFSKEFQSFFNKLAIEDRVERVVHLVALDEDRQVFLPTLISESPINSDSRKELWFRGNHGDMGGGWPDEDESQRPFRRRQVTLRFMLNQDHELKLIEGWEDTKHVKVSPSAKGKIHGQADYSTKEAWGGLQKREFKQGEDSPIPYDPIPAVTMSQ